MTTTSKRDWIDDAKERIHAELNTMYRYQNSRPADASQEFADWYSERMRETKERIAAIIREAHAAQPHPYIRQRAEAAARDIPCGKHRRMDCIADECRGDRQDNSGRIARHFSDLSPCAELQEAPQRIGEWQKDCPCNCSSCYEFRDYYSRLRAALEGSGQ